MIEKIEKELRNLANPEIAEHSKRFFKSGKGEYGEGDQFLGIRVPTLRKMVKHYQDTPVKAAIKLLKTPYHEQRLFAVLLLVRKYEKADDANKTTIYELYLKNTKYINNWDLVDSSAMQIVGAYLKDKDKHVLYSLAKSNSLWERRISIISTFFFIKQGMFSHTLKISTILLNDSEDLIHKAVGWMLREVGNRNREKEETFLKKHYKKMPRTMLRYSIEKFPEDIRQEYLKGEK